jgi:predicted outer membrane protein
MQKASRTKLDLMSGDSFDRSYVKGMIDDHKQTLIISRFIDERGAVHQRAAPFLHQGQKRSYINIVTKLVRQ